MIWYGIGVVYLCFSGFAYRVDGRSDDFLLYSYDLFVENGIETVSTNNGAAEMDVFRLPTDVFPVSYGLEVATDFVNLTYSGRVEIVVQTTVKTCQIILNAKDLLVTGVEVIDQKLNASLTVVNHYLVDKNEQMVILLNDTVRCLIPGRFYVIMVDFGALLRNDMSGYYKSSYKENNVTKWLAVTKFEPTHARKAFPCFDEPAFKVPFKVSLRRRSDQITLSNMPLLNSTKIHNTNMFWDIFQETPPISTYLVAFFVGEFYAMKSPTVGIYTHKNYVEQAKYIANKSPILLKAMENFTDVDYMLPKIDLLAIPDFAAGAMENWGLNTYRERLLLLSENSKTKTKEFVTTVVEHELSHQWFGDLVTCAWWDFLWLNEGFATFFEYFATKMVEPDWRLEDVFVYEVHQDALEADQYPTHPISASVETLAQIKGMFDDISYSKAGAVIRMLQYIVTEENFKNALNLYLENNKYRAATPEDLWIAFENVLYDAEFELDDSVTITQFMKSWTEQAGYPLLYIIKENNTFIISQERFLVETSNEIDTTKWIIGLTYTTESIKDFNGVLPKNWMKEKKMILSNQTEPGWYIFNLQSIGFYRVNYEEENWNALINQLNNDCSVIHVLNRAQLIDDAFNLAKANKVDYILALSLSKYLINENDVVPWYSAKNGFSYLLNRMRRCPHSYNYFKTYVGHLAELIYTKVEDLVVNHNNSDHSIQTGWNAFSNWACKLDNEICTKSASSYFELWRQGKKIPADIKDAAFCIGVKNGNSEIWNIILNVYINSKSASDRQSAQLALACTSDIVQLTKYLNFIFDGYNGPIRPQDFKVIYQTVPSSPVGISAMTEFLTTKLDRIVKEVINGEQVATSIYSILASRVAFDEEILKIDNLRKNSSIPEYLRKKFNSSYSTVEDNLNWFHLYHHEIGKWSKTTVHNLGLDQGKSISTVPSETTEVTSSKPYTVNPNDQIVPSSSISAKGQDYYLILLIISSTLLINTFF